eukprot:TRINITY_DN12523_c0_g2_i4.p2 TRINITY_DN12523_c0_g2~~TRINITY_DN12523_c0_g2_i4.p2  ORF type:complete len:144 (-),score=39.68 TRINITY_DN12523_c0_g2_i4:318-749(-)
MELGFPKDHVESAMQAASNNPERAADYLINEISAQPHAEPGAEEHDEEMEGEEYEAPEAETSLAELRERILQDPNYLQELMQELQAVNPQLYQAMQQDPQGALQTLLGEHEAEMEDEEQPEPDIQITEEEKAAIDRVTTALTE